MLSLFVTALLAVSTFAAPNDAQRRDVGEAEVPAGWTAVGCFTDQGGERTLNAVSASSPDLMTLAVCTSFCSHNFGAFTYAGVEFGKECWCDNTINPPGTPADSGCDMECSGDVTQSCGGPNRVFIAQRNAA